MSLMQEYKNVVIGVLAHVDAGKTTLSEAMLYLSGKIKKQGRVDHGDSFLDSHSLERARGITIFSKQAGFQYENSRITLLDTPGHVDFSTEAERTMQVLDAVVLVISGTDGVQAHTETLWRLIKRYRLPCFIFVSKMDLPGADRAALMAELQNRLDESCQELDGEENAVYERLAMCSEEAMDKFLAQGRLERGDIGKLVRERRLYPCFFGSGLRLEGVEQLLQAIDAYAPQSQARDGFAAKVYKIDRDSRGSRMSFMKVTGGEIKVRQEISYMNEKGERLSEKISQLRLYSGSRFEAVESAKPGQICAALGLSESYPGQGLGLEADSAAPVLEPVLSYRLRLPQGTDAALIFPKLKQLGEEDPQLRLHWNQGAGEISVQLMGRVQAEIFRCLVKERFDVALELDSGSIMYRETVSRTVEGVGHFEPLRHYAEVHLLIEPLPRGSGIVLDSSCPEDVLDRNWQRLILSHLQERQHPGVLTGSPVTDMKITLAAGRAHPKHTEGGDFREAVYRALRQGLMQADCLLLEPWYRFSMHVQPEHIGRAISDVRAMNGTFSSPEQAQDMLRLEGAAPVSAIGGYGESLLAYTHGRGRLSLQPDGYRPCHRQKELVESMGYDAQRDTENPCGSVFCAHGAGFNVSWDRVSEYMHLESCLKKKAQDSVAAPRPRPSLNIDERELEAIMEREFGPIRRKSYSAPQLNRAEEQRPVRENAEEYIIVDGYNLIFAWDELKSLAQQRLDLARGRLMDMLSNYCGFTKTQLVLVFDGFRTPGNPGSRSDYHNIHVAYTSAAETGDMYIERIADEIGKNYSVRVVTSDNLIRLSALRSGVLRTSSKEFKAQVEGVLDMIEQLLDKTNPNPHKTRLKDGKQ